MLEYDDIVGGGGHRSPLRPHLSNQLQGTSARGAADPAVCSKGARVSSFIKMEMNRCCSLRVYVN